MSPNGKALPDRTVELFKRILLPASPALAILIVFLSALHWDLILLAATVFTLMAAIIFLLVANILQRRRSTRALKLSEMKYHDLFCNAPDMFYTIDNTTAAVMECNNAFLQFTGYSREEVIGRSIFDFYDVESAADSRELFNQFHLSRPIRNLERTVIRKDGSKAHVILNASGLRDEEGRILYGRSIWRDISDRKRAEESLTRYNSDLEAKVRERTQELSDLNAALTAEIEERKRVEETLRYNESCLARAESIAHLGHWEWNREINEMVWSEELYRILGYEPHEVTPAYEFFEQSIHPLCRADVATAITDATNTKRPFSIDFRIFGKGGRLLHVHSHGETLLGPEDKPVKMIGTILDITEFKERERMIKESEETLRLALAAAKQGMYDLNLKTGESTLSPEYAAMLGYGPVETRRMPWQWMNDVHPGDRVLLKAALQDLIAGKTPSYKVEYRRRTVAGKWLWFSSCGKIVQWDEDGKPLRLIGIISDITVHKLTEERMNRTLHERELLLREVHHRTKNNMQLVSSLLDFQGMIIDDPQLVRILSESQNKIRSIALIHEKLYNSTDFANIDLRNYVEELFFELSRFYTGQRHDIFLNIESNNVRIGIDIAVPCGLILNELISNSIKHAFPADRPGEVKVILRELTPKEMIEIVVSDNGVGLPGDIDPHTTRSMGLFLVNGLVENQLLGKMLVTRNSGTEFRIRVPLNRRRTGPQFRN